MVLMYNLLMSKGFSESNIYVLHADGTDFPGIDNYYHYPIVNKQFTDYPGTLDSIQSVLGALLAGNTQLGIPALQFDDFLFVWVRGHGGYVGNNANLEVYYDPPDPSNSPLFASEFGAYINAVACQKIVMCFGQCNSGGVDDFVTHYNTIVLTACELGESSHDADDKPSENAPEIPGLEKKIHGAIPYLNTEFNFHTSSVLHGMNSLNIPHYNGILYSTADTNDDNYISIREAFEWADIRDSWVDSHLTYRDDDNTGASTSLEYPSFYMETLLPRLQFTAI